ncbi:MAG: DUF4337 domain-containing protein [Ginsengibacter sp.]
MEVPTEHLNEVINEKAEELSLEKENKWTLFVAISTALMAVLAALGSMYSGHQSNEALIMQIKASDQWAYYQAKGIKEEIRMLLPASANIKSPEATAKEQEAVKQMAEQFEKESEANLQRHLTFSRSVTLLQVAVAISAISIITRKRFLWYAGMAIAIGGATFFIMGLL